MVRVTPRIRGSLLALAVLVAGCQSSDGPAAATDRKSERAGAPNLVTALGRIEPKDGIIEVAGPSRPSVVIAKLLVEESERVQAGQPLAELDSVTADEAAVAKAKAALRNAEAELARVRALLQQRIMSVEALDNAQMRVDVARADLAAAESVLDLDIIRAPVAGQIVKIHARRGERVGPYGFAEIAQNDQMYAVAEVYETDIGRVKVGQKATVRSPAFEKELTGSVDRIGMKIGKQDVLATDPVARTDARVVEVRVKLDESPKAAGLSNLQVEVAIQP